MTVKEKLLRIKKLADEMYRAAQYLTTDASHLHKAMDEYHQFIVHDYHKEEPVSEDLEGAAQEYVTKEGYLAGLHYNSMVRSFKEGAKWQKQQDQSTIELAEDHAMLAGMEKMKEQMMVKAIDGYVIEDIEEGNGDFLLSAEYIPKSMGLKDQQKVKVIVIRED